MYGFHMCEFNVYMNDRWSYGMLHISGIDSQTGYTIPSVVPTVSSENLRAVDI